MTTVVLLFFQDHIRRPGLYKGRLWALPLPACYWPSTPTSSCCPLVSCLPFYDYGFGWLIPAIVGGVLGWLLSKPDSAGAEQ